MESPRPSGRPECASKSPRWVCPVSSAVIRKSCRAACASVLHSRASLVNDPKILLMDEPFAALDAQTRTMMQQELLRVWSAARRTAIFITHNIEEALLLGDRVVVMTARPGRIKEIVTVNLTRPRDVTSAEFNETRRRIGLLLESEVQATFAAMQNGGAS